MILHWNLLLAVFIKRPQARVQIGASTSFLLYLELAKLQFFECHIFVEMSKIAQHAPLENLFFRR